jgi:hypothetical protein
MCGFKKLLESMYGYEMDKKVLITLSPLLITPASLLITRIPLLVIVALYTQIIHTGHVDGLVQATSHL